MVELDTTRMPRLALAGISLSFILLIVGFFLALRGFEANQHADQMVTHTYSVVESTAELSTALERAEAARRGFLLDQKVYRDEAFRDSFGKILPTLQQVEDLTGDNPQQQDQIDRMKPMIRRELADLDWTMRLARQGRVADARIAFERQANQATLRQIRSSIEKIRSREGLLLAQRLQVEADSQAQLRILLALIGILLIASALGAFWLLRRNAVQLAASRDRLHLLNTDLEGEVERRTADLQRANDEVQRFAYIVSHDLRSPLVNILGFTAELETTNKTLGGLIASAEKEAPSIVTPEVREAQIDLPEAIGFIRASTQKMDRLINAILRLSREGRRTLTPQTLAMDDVVDDIAASLKQRVDEAGATLTVEHPLPEIVNDRVAIEQIFSNIIENAVKYLADGRPGQVTVRGRKEQLRAIFEVEDNGRGIDPKDHERIFELFRRSGTQDRSGEGIGLAQVQALVNRLGGYIDVESQLGEGSLFRLNLPITYVDHGSGE